MAHVISDDAEKILDEQFDVLDKGFVRLVDYLGGDTRIVQAARVSYGKGTTSVRRDKMLIEYLLQHEHTSPFEQVVLTFHCKMPIFVARQWIRHRTARVNEISGRYSEMADEFYIPDKSVIRQQSKKNLQGRDDLTDVPAEIQKKVLEILKRDRETAFSGYKEMLDDEIARELARINLPLSLYTEWYWQIDLSNLFRFLKLRLDWHAQYEIRCYARVIGNLTKRVAPLAYSAFENTILGTRKVTKSQAQRIAKLLKEHDPDLLVEVDWLDLESPEGDVY
ncbi:FAD-dependent thymidylate synthase [bacterium]|nr:FAD-dependent thymidylate synthase [bacterium]